MRVRSAFEWEVHEPEALKQGATPAMLEAIRNGAPSLGDAQCDAAAAFARSVLARVRIDDALFEALREFFGDDGVVELVVLLGYYGLLADLMQVFSIE